MKEKRPLELRTLGEWRWVILCLAVLAAIASLDWFPGAAQGQTPTPTPSRTPFPFATERAPLPVVTLLPLGDPDTGPCDGCMIDPSTFDRIRTLIDPDVRILTPERGVSLAIEMDNLTPNTVVTVGLYWYYADQQSLKLVAVDERRLDEQSNYALPVDLPANLPGGQYLFVLCQHEQADCVAETILAQLIRGEVGDGFAIQQFELPPLAQIEAVVTADAQVEALDAMLRLDENLTNSDEIEAEWVVDGETLGYTTNPSLNLAQPYQYLDPDAAQLQLYATGALPKYYLEQYAPAWVDAIPALDNVGLLPGEYELKVSVNGYVEDVQVIDVAATEP